MQSCMTILQIRLYFCQLLLSHHQYITHHQHIITIYTIHHQHIITTTINYTSLILIYRSFRCSYHRTLNSCFKQVGDYNIQSSIDWCSLITHITVISTNSPSSCCHFYPLLTIILSNLFTHDDSMLYYSRTKKRYAIGAACIGGGQGMAIILKNAHL